MAEIIRSIEFSYPPTTPSVSASPAINCGQLPGSDNLVGVVNEHVYVYILTKFISKRTRSITHSLCVRDRNQLAHFIYTCMTSKFYLNKKC